MSLQLVVGRRRLLFNFAFVCCLLTHDFTKATAAESIATCETTVQTREVGGFATNPIDEASGLALAPDGNHFFVTNDSGDKPRFFRTALDGSAIEDIRMKAWKPFDVEELSVGSCPRDVGGDCLAVADIGDNRDRRRNVEIAFIKISDLKEHVTEVSLAKKIKFSYPEGARNAEAFAILNSRFGLIVSKEQDRRSRATKPAQAYIVDFDQARTWRVATWDVPTWVRDQGLSALVTGLSIHISPAGKIRVLLLTYRDVIELAVETDILTSTTWPPRPWSVTARTIYKIDPLEQQEAIAFDKTGDGFYYTSEAPLALLGAKRAPIRRVEKLTCP